MGMTIEDCISKLTEILEEATEDENAVCYVTDVDEPTLKMAIDTMRKYQQLEDFARWVAGEIIDEDMWVLNYSAFAELACRKLVKLGIIQESNGEYLYEEVEDGEDNIHQ